MNGNGADGFRIGLAIKHAHFAQRAAMDNALREMGLTASQWGVLRLLARQGSLSNAELARKLACTAQTMWEMTQHLEREGLIERGKHPTHGTVLPIQITPEGRRVLEEANVVVYAIEERMLEGLSAEEIERVREVLERCVGNLSAQPLAPSSAER